MYEMNDLRILKRKDVYELLRDEEKNTIELVKTAYKLHHRKKTVLPFSSFLRFNNQSRDRIIALPAYINENGGMAGMKWISSFPNNINKNMERASAVCIVNDINTGRVRGFLEGALVSAERTAASAAIAASVLQQDKNECILGIIGCGYINSTIFRYLRTIHPRIKKVIIYDIDFERAKIFNKSIDYETEIVTCVRDVFSKAQLISIATTASTPFISLDELGDDNHVILDISLRDLKEDIILTSNNIVDDVDHVCRENTSVNLAEIQSKSRDFIDGTICEILDGKDIKFTKKNIVYSPFGLGILDLYLSDYLIKKAENKNIGLQIKDFYE